MKYHVYLVGYPAPGWYDSEGRVANEELARRLIRESDFVAIAQDGIPIGHRVETVTLQPGGNGVAPPTGSVLVCVGHQHGGKVALLSDEAGNAA